MTTTSKPLKFYSAVAIKRFCLNSGFVEPGAPLFLAKWEENYVVAHDATNFFIATEAQASEYVRTERNDKNKPIPAQNPPQFTTEAPEFQWVVECGEVCPDTGEENTFSSSSKPSKEEAFLLADSWDGTEIAGARGFIRIRGPGFYQVKRPVASTRAGSPQLPQSNCVTSNLLEQFRQLRREHNMHPQQPSVVPAATEQQPSYGLPGGEVFSLSGARRENLQETIQELLMNQQINTITLWDQLTTLPRTRRRW